MIVDFEKIGVPFPSDKDNVLFSNGDTQDIIKAIMHGDKQQRTKNLIGKLANLLKGATDYETFYNIWAFARENFTYKTDKAGHERVKAPNWMLYFRIGDCKSYSLFIAAVLFRLGFKYEYDFVGYNNDKENPTHVFVIGYTRDGREVIIDAVHTKFDDEPPHTFSKRINPSQGGISGIRI